MRLRTKEHRRTTATNTRRFYFKYYKVDDDHSLAVPAGKCRCGKVTDMYCVKCNTHTCEKHLFTDGDDYYCLSCKEEDARAFTKKEIRNIRNASLF